MAASSGDGIPKQLAALLGWGTVRIRKTDEMPPRISVIDVVQAITGKDARHAAQEVRTLCSRYPEVDQMLVHFLFRGQGQRKTFVTSVRGIVEIVMLVRRPHAAMVRRQAAELLCRWLGGRLRIIDEMCKTRGFQEVLAAHRPDDARRVFGLEVDAAPAVDGTVGEQLARVDSNCVHVIVLVG